jgi:protein-L-isoaspartate O-methyltransferase
LKIGGRLVIPVGEAGEAQELLVIIRKSATEFTAEKVCGVVYVPLVCPAILRVPYFFP